MILALVKQRRDRMMKRVDALQRKLVQLHRQCLSDFVAFASNVKPSGGGRPWINPHVIRNRLDVLHAHVAQLMQPAFIDLMHQGRDSANAVLAAAVKVPTKRHKEAADTPEDDETQRSIVDQMLLRPMTVDEAHNILLSKNGEGLTWAEQLARSSKRVADPDALANALAQGVGDNLSLPALRKKIMPFVEDLSVSAQRIARTEGLRIAGTAQQRQYDVADAEGVGITGMRMHCAMGPRSAEDHKLRNDKYYKKTGPGAYVAEDGETFPGWPYGHPNCMCYAAPEFDLNQPSPRLGSGMASGVGGSGDEPPASPDPTTSEKQTGRPLKELIRDAESYVAGTPVEHAIVFDAQGNEILRKRGTADYVDLGGVNLEGTTIVHNHPDGKHSSGVWIRNIPPSVDDDLRTLLEEKPSHVIAVTDLYRFRLRAKSDHRFSNWESRFAYIQDKWKQAIDKETKQRADQLATQVAKGLMTAHERDIAVLSGISEDGHRAWSKIASSCRLVYRREKRQ